MNDSFISSVLASVVATLIVTLTQKRKKCIKLVKFCFRKLFFKSELQIDLDSPPAMGVVYRPRRFWKWLIKKSRK